MFPRQLQGIVVLYFVLAVLKGVTGQETACCPRCRLDDDGARCLSLIRQKAQDMSAFPFSSPYSTLCPPNKQDNSNCYWTPERLPLDQPYSLSMLAFGAQCQEDPLSGLDRYLDVHYTSPPGTYAGCDTTFSSNDEIHVRLDPLSNSSVSAWFQRQRPTFEWRAERDELFTLLFVDFEGRVLHGAYANIRGNEVRNSLELREYASSLNMRVIDRTFTFLLYKQGREIKSQYLPRQNFNLTRLVERFNLEGPVGINWMLVEADAYSVQRARSMFDVQSCPMLIQKELMRTRPDLPFLSQPYDLSVHLRVRFTSKELIHTCGLLSLNHPANDLFLDPIGNLVINTARLSEDSTRTFYMEMNKVNPNNEVDFTGKLYTLLFIGGDAPVLHGLTVNIHGDDVTSGTEVVPYRQPAPPSISAYYFLLFEQKEEISLAATAGFTQTTCPEPRCLYGVIQAFVSVNNLELVGATWVTADGADYAECAH